MFQAKNLSKSFGGVKVLDDVSLDIRPGEVHALMGENGAGKSTLMKILADLLHPDSGTIEGSGGASVAMIHQELMPFLDLTVAENISMGREPTRRFPGWVDRAAMRSHASEILARLAAPLDPNRPVRGLSVADQQIVEIAKALSREASFILMDEPTSALAAQEAESLFAVIRDLTAQGIGILYTSHKMDEIFRIANRITVLRDGRHIATRLVGELDEPTLITLMVGRELKGVPRASSATSSRPLREPQESRLPPRPGEIVGLAGLMGSGRTELALQLLKEPRSARMAMVTEDRKETGIIPHLSIQQNLTLESLPRFCHGPWIDRRAEAGAAARMIEALGIRARSLRQEIVELSGGNQQKVMIGRALLAEPEILILDEPTRGIDVAAKADVHELIRHLARDGKRILMISSEMPEILSLSHRILVMRQGAISAELDPRTTTQEEILKFAMPEGK